ncbi:TusE/DsrC/DsvC family sulfur relay protein [Desulfosediminicola ganghwensis]|uniref:TusE/DsrC/DsvC family sulfur relay protein n=1 Tax=Desulfosediminicola ganghwensis TaxID=2569540 RepID=UPI0010AC9815|nr:TusE/DsrC/DsvC family sulfur relay protein [Desulfosediminicola ganghwensis]
MTQLECAGKNVTIDNDGFLTNIDDWNEDVARVLAKREGVDELDDHQIEIIKFMREYYKKFQAFPILNYVCKNVHQPKNCVSEAFVNPIKAWKIAGLPQASHINFETVDGEHYVLDI